MSYHSWSTYGYGIPESSINYTNEGVYKLAQLCPKTKSYFEDLIQERGINLKEDGYDEISDLIDQYENDNCLIGVGAIICDVINSREEIKFSLVDDYGGNNFILYTRSFPWSLRTEELALKPNDIQDIINKYLMLIDSNIIACDYYNVENGG